MAEVESTIQESEISQNVKAGIEEMQNEIGDISEKVNAEIEKHEEVKKEVEQPSMEK